MKKQRLGIDGPSVSAICLGTMYFGNQTDGETSYAILDDYVAAGGSFLDTANCYAAWAPGFNGGESETLLGQWLRDRHNREEMFIATKSGFGYSGVEPGLRADQIECECESSLRRLGIETIDLFYSHWDDRNSLIEERMKAYDKLVKKGKVRYIGASNHRAWRMEEARALCQSLNLPPYCCIQQRYTYLHPKPGLNFDPQVAANEDLLDFCRNKGVALLAYTPLLKGSYSRVDRPLPETYKNPTNDTRLAILKSVAVELGVTENQLVLAWLMQQDPPVIPVAGASDINQLRENLAALDLQLSVEHLEKLNLAGTVSEF